MKANLRKLAIYMSRLAIYAIIFCYSMTIGLCNDAGAQHKLLSEITVDLTHSTSTFLKLIEEVEKASNFSFVYSEREVRKTRLDVAAGYWNMNDLLHKVSREAEVSIRRVNETIVVIGIRYGQKPTVSEKIVSEVEISGKVTDENKEPLPGVTIVEKGTNNGVVTDVEGKFRLTVQEGAVLQVSSVGYLSQEIAIGDQSAFDIRLEPDLTNLEEIVVVGYGEQRKISFTGSQTSVSPLELNQPVANVSTMLAGRLAGITGVQRSGEPGRDGADIWIRGISNLSGSNSPLILVDGVQRSMNNIAPQDIESFTVLKDASATAVYGVRGANGVILINTKKGAIGKPKVTFDYNQGVTRFVKVPELLGGIDYMKLSNEALTTRGGAPRYSEETIERTANNYDPFVYPNVNWMDEVFRDWGYNRKSTLNVSGGAEDAQYYVSLGYYDETGLYTTDALANYDSKARYSRYNLTTNINLNLTSTTKVDVGVQGYLSNGNYPGESAQTIFNGALAISPVEYPVLYPGGFVPGRSPNGGLRNPYADATLRGYQNENKNQLYSNLRITQDLEALTEGLTATAMFAFDAYNEHRIERRKREDTWIVDANNPRNLDGTLNLGTVPTFQGQNFLSYSRDNGGNRRFYMEAALNYDRTFGAHRIGGLLLANRTEYLDAFAGDFTGSIPFRNQGLASRVTYSYDDRYFVEFNAGYNGSEDFAPSNRYGFFPALGFGWVLSNESFFGNLGNTIDFLKIRYTDGIVGSDSGADRFSYIGKVERNGDFGYYFGRNAAKYDGIVENTYGVDIIWAEARKQDVGLEINMFNRAFGLIVDIFKERTEGAFLERGDIPAYIGLNSVPKGNIGIVENKGFDGTVNYSKGFKNFAVNFRGTFSYNVNKILENGRPEQAYPWMERRGNPILARYGYIAERLFTYEDDTNGDGFITPEDGDFAEQFGQVMPGDIKYKDLNGDGRIDAFDETKIGLGDVPELTYGFGLNLAYKNLDLSLFFQGQYGADIIIGGTGIIPFQGDGGGANLYKVTLDRWSEDNPDPDAMYPRLSYGSSAIGMSNNTKVSTWWLRDIDFLRLKTAEIGYLLPAHLVEAVKLKSARIYLRGVNLLTFSKFDFWDPELSLSSNGASYPNISVYSLGINIQL